MKNKNKTHTLIISDLHLGSMVSRPSDILSFLKNYEFEKLILLGDIFESLNFGKLGKNDWRLISYISELSKRKKVIWVEGNHDRGLTEIFNSLTNVSVYKSYSWKYEERKYLAIHGHQFDNFLSNNVVISFIANQIYKGIQLVDFNDKRISHYVKRRSKGWLRLSEKVARRALLYAKLQSVDYIFCGHTHKSKKIKQGRIAYYNSGCWTDIPSTYITLDAELIKICKYEK